ncbi:hypothetical protein LJK88_17040 [Paenibacillus sp. P26]|nr:hypothetical protein LJK88_17040 [Paenibacillus sp. P26]UUZ96516.1 hypothetical protein LJK87_20755 [Paenibacillus sp. P25]
MKALLRTRVWTAALMVPVLALGLAFPGLAETQGSPPPGTKPQTSGMANEANEPAPAVPSYSEVLERWKREGAAADHTGSITVPGPKLAGRSGQAGVSTGSYEGKNNVLIWNAQGDEWIEYEVDVKQGGLYQIDISYHPFVDTKHRKPVAWNVTLDGVSPYPEAKSVQLYRHWRDRLPARKDDNGDEIRPMAEDVSGWMTAPFRDSAGAYEGPLLWYLTPGKHRLRLSGSDPVAIESVTFKAPDRTADYKTARSAMPEAAPVQAEPIVIEAEAAGWKNDSSIPLAYDNDIASVPYVRGKSPTTRSTASAGPRAIRRSAGALKCRKPAITISACARSSRSCPTARPSGPSRSTAKCPIPS